METSRAHTLRKWKFEVIDVDITSIPYATLSNGWRTASADNVVLAFCGWCGNGLILMNPSEWWASRRTIRKKPSNRTYVGRSCPYCFAVCLLPDKTEYDALVAKGQSNG